MHPKISNSPTENMIRHIIKSFNKSPIGDAAYEIESIDENIVNGIQVNIKYGDDHYHDRIIISNLEISTFLWMHIK